MATRPGRGGLRCLRRPCCPVRSLRRRNTSTYPCCWRKRASAPQTTPSTKVTDQILQPPRTLAVESGDTVSLIPSQLESLCACCSDGRFPDCALARRTPYLSRCWLLCKVAFLKKEFKTISMVFFLLPGLQTVFCSICTFEKLV